MNLLHFFILFQMNKKKMTQSGFKPDTSGLTYQRSYQLSSPVLLLAVPQSLLGVGCQSEIHKPRNVVCPGINTPSKRYI